MMLRRTSLGSVVIAGAMFVALGCGGESTVTVDADPNAPDSSVAIDANGGLDGGDTSMSFFVTSTGVSGNGDLGGLAGADAFCTTLASNAGATRTSWVAYLSTEGDAVTVGVSAIDRLGPGPWYNANGDVLAANKVDLHPTIDPAVDRNGYIAVKPADALFLDETGGSIPGAQHDIFTGSNGDGTVFADSTCLDWTSAATSETGRVGHTDTPGNVQFSPSWNSAHDTQNCSTGGVTAFGGSGRIFCFALD